MSLYSPDKAMINGIAAPWMPGDLPTRDWTAIQATYWGVAEKSGSAQFQLGRFNRLAQFLASSRAAQHFPSAAPDADATVAVAPTLLDHVGAVTGAAISVRQSPSVASGVAIIRWKELPHRPSRQLRAYPAGLS